jgi:4-amino-4-deoxy-L-arabinose transferase-like glycosyltransferase
VSGWPPFRWLGRGGPVLALAIFALALFLPGLGGFGLWEPWEKGVVDRAAVSGSWLGPPGSREVLLPALGIRLLGIGEASARLPGALLAAGTVLAVDWAAAVLYGARAGLMAALVLAAFPLFALQARQLAPDMPLLLAGALVLPALGRLGSLEPDRKRLLWAALAVAGMALAGWWGGFLVGVVPPCLAFGAAWFLAGLRLDTRGRRLLAVGITGVGAAFAVVALVTSYRVGQPSWLLGGAPVLGPSGRSFEAVFRLLGFGLYPWSALALFVVMAPLVALDEEPTAAERSRLFAVLLPGFAVVFGLACATLQLHLIGQARLAMLPAVALILGRWLAEPTPAAPANRVLGLVVVTGTLLLTRDLWHAPQELLSVHLPARIKWPPGLSIRALLVAVGLVFAAALLARFVFDPTPARSGRFPLLASRARRAAVPVLLACSVVLTAALVHGVVPTLSRHLSPGRLPQSYRPVGASSSSVALGAVP